MVLMMADIRLENRAAQVFIISGIFNADDGIAPPQGPVIDDYLD